MLAVEIEIDVGEVGRRATVDDHLVENQQTGRRFGCFASGFVFPQDNTAQATAESKSCMTCIRSDTEIFYSSVSTTDDTIQGYLISTTENYSNIHLVVKMT